MKHYTNYKYDLVEDDELYDTTSGTDIMGLCLGFIAVCLVIGYCFFVEFVKWQNGIIYLSVIGTNTVLTQF